MPTGDIYTLDEKDDTLPTETTNPVAETPALTPRERLSYKCFYSSDSEDRSVTDVASDTPIMGRAKDVPSKGPQGKAPKAPRTTRSRKPKQQARNPRQPTPNPRVNRENRKRDCGSDEGESARPAKRVGRPLTAMTEIRKFKDDIFDLLARHTSKVHGLDDAKSEIRKLQNRILILEATLEREVKNHEETEMLHEQRVASLQDECGKLRTELVSALDKLKQDSERSVKVPDSDIARRWKELCYNVRNVVSQWLTERPYEEVDNLKRLLDGPGVASKPFPGRNRLENIEFLEFISEQKSRASLFLSKNSQVDEEALETVICTAMFHFGAFVPASKTESFPAEMRKLLTAAADLHAIMIGSKAIFMLEWIGDYDGKEFSAFDPAAMEPLNGYTGGNASGHVVEFVEAPALTKVGTADGQNFDCSMILCKASVILRERDEALQDGVVHDDIP
ncbi:hypothetical protein Trco_005727 [Trichoderma cornu-damae]|uniref:Uncharacterized protein n=1 Tax=Trichoderma cornu-damae TaxID=654480 RepID=A0A9P8TVH5_9HYPO|nr:hypothetical protein Trco_005727 [Trichoderma cornu-damae]